MTRDITPGCLETCLRDVLNQNTVSPTEKSQVRGRLHDPMGRADGLLVRPRPYARPYPSG